MQTIRNEDKTMTHHQQLPTMTKGEYLAHPADYRSVWTTERTDLANWQDVRHQYMGKRTLMRGGCLEIEGISFLIVG